MPDRESPPGHSPADPTVPSLSDLFLGFARVAVFAFGGVLPWVRYVVVEQRRWLSPDEFTDTLALAQLLPGPNIVNMSVAIGARFHGVPGAIASVLGILGLPIAIVLLLATFYAQFAEVPAVGRALTGMAAAAAGLIVAMAAKMAVPMLRKRFWPAAPVIAVVFVAVALFRYPLWPVLIVCAPLSIAAHWRVR